MGWKNKPSNFAAEVNKTGGDLVKKISAEMLQGVIMGSPVMDTPKGSLDQLTFNDGAKEILKAKLGSCVYIQNNISYALALENGHSDQAPKGVYALTFRYISEKYK